jgi:hypothetical protein
LEIVRLSQRYGAAITRSEKFIFTGPAAPPDGADRMNDLPRQEPVAPGDPGITGHAPVERPALREQLRARRAMDRAVNTTTAEQRFIRCVDDRIDAQRRYIRNDDFESRRTNNAASRRQADAGALTVTPLSPNSFCNSPAWNISRTISQPPTNSPLTYNCGIVGQLE